MTEVPSTTGARRRRPRAERPKAIASYRVVVWQKINADLVGTLREIAEAEGVSFSVDEGRRGTTLTFGQRPTRRRSAPELSREQQQDVMKKFREALRRDPTRVISVVDNLAGSDTQTND